MHQTLYNELSLILGQSSKIYLIVVVDSKCFLNHSSYNILLNLRALPLEIDDIL